MKHFESDEISFCTVLVLRSNSASVLYIKAVNKEQTSLSRGIQKVQREIHQNTNLDFNNVLHPGHFL